MSYIDIVAAYPACIPLYRTWLTKFLKYNEPRVSKFRNSKKESIFGFIRAELSRIDYARDSDGGGTPPHSMCRLDQSGFFDAVKSAMVVNNIFVDKAIANDALTVSGSGPRQKLRYLQQVFEIEARDIKQRVATKLLRKEPIMDIVWYCALRRKEIAFLQMDTAFSEIGKPRVGPIPRVPGQRIDIYPDSTSPVIECNGAHLISYIAEKIGPAESSNVHYISERLEHGARIEYDLTVFERDEETGEYSWHHFQESGKKPMQSIFDTISFLYDELVSSMRTTMMSSRPRRYSATLRRRLQSKFNTASHNHKRQRSSKTGSSKTNSPDIETETMRRRINLIAKMWWWFCQAMPLYRGSAAVAEFIFMPMVELYTHYRYTVRAEKTPTNLVDIYALTYGKDEFVEMFGQQFLKRYVPNNVPKFDSRHFV